MLGSFTFESSMTNLPHMLGLYISLRKTREKLFFYLVIRNEFYLFRSHLILVCSCVTVPIKNVDDRRYIIQIFSKQAGKYLNTPVAHLLSVI